ncbi:MAG TPA: chloride channel protein [Dehalococcoidia bacterium]|nr:chloride channel protein [Dehalococcoidia bacterium]
MLRPESSQPDPASGAAGAIPPAGLGLVARAAAWLATDEQARLGDFTTTPRLLVISAIAVAIGALSAVVAKVLLRLIAFFTNLFFYGDISVRNVSPAHNHLGPFVIVIPVIGGLIVGVMARYGSERIRGHGIPEAIESILISGSKMEPKVAVLKPLSSAIAIGSGGPFGAEGPIVVTGGAFGSLVAQFFHLTSAERKTLLVAGAAGGMSAIFATPIAAVMLAVEILLFEWKPRSIIPVALSSATAAVTRIYLLGNGPVFPTPAESLHVTFGLLLACAAAGVVAGLFALVLTSAVYGAEDTFHRLPIHWMWWPAIGGLVIGIGGLIFPRALGVGYDTIGDLLDGDRAMTLIAGILLVKTTIWVLSLSSGSSGGILAPQMMMGAALGALLSYIFPHEPPGFWPLIGMAAILGGNMRAPFTAVLFSVEVTHDMEALLPALVAVAIAYGLTVLVLRRSILTEKVARRGYHLQHEYAVDPLEVLLVRDVMRTRVAALEAATPVRALAEATLGGESGTANRGQRLYPVVDDGQRVIGVASRAELRMLADQAAHMDGAKVIDHARKDVVVAHPDESVRAVVYRMATCGFTRMPVVDRRSGALVGMISLEDTLKARSRALEAERFRERVLDVRLLFSRRRPDRDPSPEPTIP